MGRQKHDILSKNFNLKFRKNTDTNAYVLAYMYSYN